MSTANSFRAATVMLAALRYEIQACRGDGACRLPGAGASNTFRVELAAEP